MLELAGAAWVWERACAWDEPQAEPESPEEQDRAMEELRV